MTTEYLQFAMAMVLFLGILVGSYWFVYVPRGRRAEGDAGSSAGAGAGGGGGGEAGSGPGNTSAPEVRRSDER